MMKYIFVSVIGVMFFLSIRFLFSPGYFPMHDDAQVARVIEMKKALIDGQFPVRWVSDLGYGYGYPLFEFYAPLPYYFGGIMNAGGIDSVVSTKLMMGVGIVLGVIGMFLAGTIFFGRLGGMLASVAFTLFPYRAVQLFVRGAIGELWATSFIPFVIIGYYFLFRKQTRKLGLLVGIFGLTGVFLSHTILGLILAFGIFISILSYGIYRFVRKTWDVPLFLSMGSVLLLSVDLAAFFLLPAFFEMGSTNVASVIGPTADFRNHFVCLSQLWVSPWGFGGSTDTCADGLSLQLGKMHILLALVSIGIFFSLVFRKVRISVKHWYLTFLFLLILTLFFMLSYSKPFWEILPYSSFIQYPWRLLSLSGIFMALLIGFLGWPKTPLWGKSVGIVGIAVMALIALPLFSPQYIYEKSTVAFEDVKELRFRASRVSDEYLPKDFVKPNNEKEVPSSHMPSSDSVTVNKSIEKSSVSEYDITVTHPVDLTLSFADYPGWEYYLDGVRIFPRVESGRPIIVLSEGDHHVRIILKDTIVRRVSNVLSLVTLIVLPFLFYGKKAKR